MHGSKCVVSAEMLPGAASKDYLCSLLATK